MACLLLVNFPVAFVYVLSADNVMSRVTIRIVNESGNKIDAIAIEGIGVDKHVGPVTAGGYNRVYLRHVGEGGINFIARQGDREFKGELNGYVVGGEDITLRFLPDGKFEVGNNRETPYLARLIGDSYSRRSVRPPSMLQHVAGGVGEFAAGEHGDGAADVVRFAPAVFDREAVRRSACRTFL